MRTELALLVVCAFNTANAMDYSSVLDTMVQIAEKEAAVVINSEGDLLVGLAE